MEYLTALLTFLLLWPYITTKATNRSRSVFELTFADRWAYDSRLETVGTGDDQKKVKAIALTHQNTAKNVNSEWLKVLKPKDCPHWCTSSRKAILPGLCQIVLPNGHGMAKYQSLWENSYTNHAWTEE